jgi:hypothetical protein
MVRVIHQLGKNSIQTHRDKLDVLRHIIKNVSKRLVQLSDIRKLSDVTKLSHPYSEWPGWVRVEDFAFVLEIPRVCQLSKETRTSSPSLECAHNGARILAGAAQTTAGSSWWVRSNCCQGWQKLQPMHQIHLNQMWCRWWCFWNKPDFTENPRKIAENPRKIRRKPPTRLVWRRLRYNVVYYESINRELNIKPIYECRCDERLKTKVEEFTCLVYTGWLGGLEHLKIKARLIDEKFPSVMGECVFLKW